jgi:hypothetical protein
MAAFKPEVHVSPLVDKMDMKFQMQLLCFGAAAAIISFRICPILSSTWKQYGDRVTGNMWTESSRFTASKV